MWNKGNHYGRMHRDYLVAAVQPTTAKVITEASRATTNNMLPVKVC